MKAKKLIAIFSVLMIIGTLFSFIAQALPSSDTVRFWATDWARAAVPNLWNGGSIESNNFEIIYMTPSSTETDLTYCIEPGVELHAGDALDVNDYVDHLTTSSITEPYIITKLFGRLFQYIDYNPVGFP